MSMFKKAERTQARLRLAIAGPSGSGKTYTALAIASEIAGGKPIAVVDTESGSASLYAGNFDFDVAEMHSPYHPLKYKKAIEEAAAAGYGCIILDSLSHGWEGTGGLLDVVDEKTKASQSKSAFSVGWKDATPIQNELIEAIVTAPIHVIATMRSKTDYVLEQGKAPKKVGMKAIQREGIEYEFTIVFQMTLDNDAIVEKTRCSALAGRVFNKPGKEVASIINAWLSEGAPDVAQAIETATTPQKPLHGHTDTRQAEAPKQINVAPVEPPTEVIVQGKDDFDRVLNELLEEENDNLRKAFHATGIKTFGNDWNKGARKWLITEYTRAKTPHSIRDSETDLVNSERQALIDDMSKNGPARVKKYAQSQKVVALETQMHEHMTAAVPA